MKKYILSVLTAIFLSNFSFGQIRSGEVVYKVRDARNFEKHLEDKNFTPNQKSGMNAWFDEIKAALPYLSFHLTFNKNEAHYQAPDFMENDNGIDLNSAKRFVGSGGTFYTNIEKKMRLHQINYINKDWLIKLKISDLDWHITDETKEIQGYVCRKATTTFGSIFVRKGEITAWFTTELPFQFGPMSYAGLPGLILGLQQNYFYFYADKISLSKKDQKIKKPIKGEKVTQDEYFKKAKRREEKVKKSRYGG